MSQLQADYSRQINEYASQNRALQDQMQSLNARVAGMESQLAQLLQALMHPAQAAPKEHETTVEQRITFNVQAIIPGRAWLKSASGETVTVAEGDVVRDLGRITKIDPYDGVVEINTGNKVVALSYGNGG
jgi:intracellular multiplication protein IcmG